jgi:hypothetical protein
MKLIAFLYRLVKPTRFSAMKICGDNMINLARIRPYLAVVSVSFGIRYLAKSG